MTWAEKLDVPLLLINGGADTGVTPLQTMALAQKLEEHGKFYELIIYAGDNHEVSRNREDRIRKTIDWFKNPPTIPIAFAVDKAFVAQGIEAAVKHYHDLKKSQPHPRVAILPCEAQSLKTQISSIPRRTENIQRPPPREEN